MVVRGLTLLVLAWLVASPARAQATLPGCTPPDLDVTLLAELLAIELGDLGADVVIGDGLCDAGRSAIELVVRDRTTGTEARDAIALGPETDVDPRAAARAVALAVAERAPRMLASLAVVVPPAPPPVLASPPAPAVDEPAASLGDPTEPRLAAAAPARPLDAERDVERDVEPAASSPSRLGATLGVSVHGRLAPVLPSWALGLGVDAGGHLDPTWSLRGEAMATWSRATAPEGDADAVVVAGALSFGGSVVQDALVDLVVGGRAEAGMLAAMGWQSGASTGTPTLHGWLTLGALADLALWLAPGAALTLDLSISGVIAGTRVSTWPTGVVIDLSALVIDLGAGARFVL